MIKSSLPVGVKTLMKYRDAGTLDFENPIQRQSGQWGNLQMSLLVQSMLLDYIIPNIYLKKEVIDKTNYLSVLDGKQRLTTVFSFINDEWSTHAKTPKVVLDGIEYDIALKKFSELDEDVKSAILGYRFTTYQIEGATDEEIEEIFARLNSGTPLSKIQQARPKMGTELAKWCNELVATDFFQKSSNLTLAQMRREDDLLMLVTSMMLMDSRWQNGFKIKTSASAAECLRFAEFMRENFDDDRKCRFECTVDYVNSAFNGAEYKFLKKNNVPIIFMVAQIAEDHSIPESAFLNLMVEFFENDITEAYKEASGTGNVKMVNVNTRIHELLGYVMAKAPEFFSEDKSEESSEVTEESNAEESAVITEDIFAEEPAETETERFVIFKLGDKEVACSVEEDIDLTKAADQLKEQKGFTEEVTFEVCEDLTRDEILEMYGEITPITEVA